jgi:hypothetical protein
LPNAKNPEEVETRVAELQRLLDDEGRTSSRPPLGTLAPEGEPQHAPPAETAPPPAVAPAPASEAAPASAPVPAKPDLSVTTAPAAAERTPIYKKWWLWTAVGVVVAGAVVGGVVAATVPKNAPAPAGAYRVSF